MNWQKTRNVLVVVALWLYVFLQIGTPLPYDYDSVSYALAIQDEINIGKNQPHAPGYLFHILLAKALHVFVPNPFKLQQILNLFYLSLFLGVLVCREEKLHNVLWAATSPLILFLCCTPVIHGANVALSALLAYLAHKAVAREGSPLVLGFVFFVSTGFRPDLAMFMGPVVLYVLFARKCTWKEWGALAVMGLAVFLAWYLPVKYLSGGVSPLAEMGKLNQAWLRTASIFWGATPFQHLRSATRFIVYAPAVLGPGSVFVLLWGWSQLEKESKIILAIAVSPFMLYGLLAYLPHASYYGTVVGFLFGWWYLRTPRQPRVGVALIAAAANLAFFWFFPCPEFQRPDQFSQRTFGENVKRQVLYLGASGRKWVVSQKSEMLFAESGLSKCPCFYIRDQAFCERAAGYLAKYKWNNQMVLEPKAGCCIIGQVREGEKPDLQYGRMGIWNGNSGVAGQGPSPGKAK